MRGSRQGTERQAHTRSRRGQQIAGLVMWVPAGLVLTLSGIALFAAWLGDAERRGRHRGPLGGPPGAQAIEERTTGASLPN